MRKLISTRTHGVLDLVTAATLVTLPRALGWGDRVTSMLTALGVGTLGYSLLTNYEFGLRKILPMRVHLALDAASGASLCAAPWIFPDEAPEVIATLVGLGLFEIAAAMLTEPEPGGLTEGVRRLMGNGQPAPTSAGYGEGLRRSSTSSML